MSIEPGTIMDEVDNALPLERETVGKRYENLDVGPWEVKYLDLELTPNTNKATILARVPDRIVSYIKLDVNLDKYPRLKFLHPGSNIWVSGKINKTSSQRIVLQEGHIEFEKNQKLLVTDILL